MTRHSQEAHAAHIRAMRECVHNAKHAPVQTVPRTTLGPAHPLASWGCYRPGKSYYTYKADVGNTYAYHLSDAEWYVEAIRTTHGKYRIYGTVVTTPEEVLTISNDSQFVSDYVIGG